MGLEPRQLNDVDKKLLDYLAEDRSTPKLLRSRLKADPEYENDTPSAAYINQRLRRLEEHDHLRNLEGTGVYELADDPREETAGESIEDYARDDYEALLDERDELREAARDALDALERVDDPDLAVEDAREALRGVIDE